MVDTKKKFTEYNEDQKKKKVHRQLNTETGISIGQVLLYIKVPRNICSTI